jgi:hypothetical protein
MAYAKKDWPSMEIQHLLLSVADHFDLEDQAVRERQIRTWRQMKLLWANYTNIWYDEVAHDWRIYDYNQRMEINDDQSYYDKSVNVFRAYLESIIAALSVTVPTVTCYPDDAQNNLDLQTAKAGDKIAQLIYKHNEVTYLWLHALYIFCTEGLVAAYNYPKEDKKYGEYKEEKFKSETVSKYICPKCQAELDDAIMQGAPLGDVPVIEASEQLEALENAEFMPNTEDVALHGAYDQERSPIICPHCAAELDPSLQKQELIVERIIGTTTKAKSRMCIETYGGLNVKVPNYARTQEEVPCLRYSYETHYANVVEEFPHLKDEFKNGSSMSALAGESDPYESWGRLSPQYNGEYPINNTTVNHYWMRPAAFNVLPTEQAEKLRKKYPDGCKLSKVQECFAGACNESLDDYWTLTKNPLADYLHHDPLGLLLVSIQDIVNEIISLILQTMEHGISQGFADPSVLNFQKYRETEVRPGDIFPAVAKSGKSLSEFFHEIKTANLSPEVMEFYRMIQELGQLVSGALPSLFGGQLSGSKTASEYSMSRSQALQRLQTPWKMLLIWWKQIFGKVIPMYIKYTVEDEKYVERDTYGNFINTIIRKAELQGKLGSIEIEGDENLPITWMQQQEVVQRLLQSGNPELMQMLFAPENLPLLKKSIGLVDLEIPGENDRNKQFEEIQVLMDSEPIMLPPDPQMLQQAQAGQSMMPQEMEIPSVEVDADLDNHEIEAQICRNWLISEAGRLARFDRPEGYRNVLLHYKQHLQFRQLQMMEQAAQAGQLPPDEEAGKETSKKKGTNGSGMAPQENEESDGSRATIQ